MTLRLLLVPEDAPAMASFTKLPKRLQNTGHQIRPKSARPNPIRQINDVNHRRKQQAAAAAAAASASTAGSPPPNPKAFSSSGPQCPNKSCPNPNVVDGTCRTCGRVADDSNIVAEVQFGENSQGAAIVQGSFLGADQGGVRSAGGPGFRRVAGGGSETRERNHREAKQMMQGFATQLNLSDYIVMAGVQKYKLVQMHNFNQGRSVNANVAVCMYLACRAETPCKVMLIDFADLVKEDVFKLGRLMKKILTDFPDTKLGFEPVYVEDLIYRFASKLEFGTLTNTVAQTAIRLLQRMDRDWMVMGRRPSGLCGACLIMAARMYNFRRTVREVVYVAKVTMHTLQARLDEFAYLPSARLTVEEFLTQDMLYEEHDPPSFYKNTEEYQAMMQEKRKAYKKRKRKTTDSDDDGDDITQDGNAVASENGTPSRDPQEAATPALPAIPIDPALLTPPATASQQPKARDADGFVIPPLPRPSGDSDASKQGDRSVIEQATRAGGSQLDVLAAEYGDVATPEPLDPDVMAIAGATGADVSSPAASPAAASGTGKKRRKKAEGSSVRTQATFRKPEYLDDEWEHDEDELEQLITERLNDPKSIEHAQAFANAEQRARLMVMEQERAAQAAASSTPGDTATPGTPIKVSEAPDVTEDEFADDPEVKNCLLSVEEREIKEMIWVNENKDWLRKQQEKAFKLKMAAAGPPKKTRRRAKKARMGEGQSSPASTPGEAAVNVLQNRAYSKRINYDAIRGLFDSAANHRGPGSVVGSEFTGSRATSITGSPEPGDRLDEDTASVVAPRRAEVRRPTPPPPASKRAGEEGAPEEGSEAEEEEAEDDYHDGAGFDGDDDNQEFGGEPYDEEEGFGEDDD